ncbi:hypothetical protein F511_32855 [Dorcoceras hygrometricum]|uniref:Uncharacterized protein n=1 Tax=Dorcoceras hygrometricum TaxID=472368 RepID=A0A2Z7DDR8_9LAMI|nr:hypothetical protein F511_32855 [Dorcoceras hygrometricum]
MHDKGINHIFDNLVRILHVVVFMGLVLDGLEDCCYFVMSRGCCCPIRTFGWMLGRVKEAEDVNFWGWKARSEAGQQASSRWKVAAVPSGAASFPGCPIVQRSRAVMAEYRW